MIDTDDVDAGSAFDHFRDGLSRAQVPMDIRCATPGEFHARHRSVDLGGVSTASVLWRPGRYEVARTSALISRSDPGVYRVLLNLSGTSEFLHQGRHATLGAGEMALFDTSAPFFGRRAPGADRTGRSIMLTLPHTALPLPPRTVRTALGAVLPSRSGTGGLVRGLLQEIDVRAGAGEIAAAHRLSAALLDVLVVHLAECSGTTSPAVRESGERTTWLRVRAFVAERLGDPGLSPECVAAAHHMSVRTLQRLFSHHNTTVAGWIRAQRLERCRHDLLDPHTAATSVRAIAHHWGFSDQAHFTRAFRTAYGMTPLQCRPAAGADGQRVGAQTQEFSPPPGEE
ncbi:hypothetical protein BBK82_20860 [Lentzea guizhouensis]|uniref:HTH araC/xylS-type domain-containing protein n=1 Tax=Lentzea guizhouensis TaxID=1586287 RepID=A0A1B2HK90_9PSEU|nr:hypothetical protein BBK82_20860 [Lentzea guizhouensis]